MIDEYEDGIDEYGEYNDAGENEEEAEEDIEYEEEERQPTQEEVEYLELRQRLKESIRRKMKRKEGGDTHLNSLEKKRKLPLDDFGSFFGPSQPVISSRVIQESKSLLENQQLASRLLNSRNTSKKPVSSSRSGLKDGLSDRCPKVVNELKRKVEQLKDTRDYSFLFSDDADVPGPSKESSSRSIPTPNSAKHRQSFGGNGRNGNGGCDDKKLGPANSHLNSRPGSSGSQLRSKPETSHDQLLCRSGSSGRQLTSKPGSQLPIKAGSSSSELISRPGSSGSQLNLRRGSSGGHLNSRPNSTVSQLKRRDGSSGSQMQSTRQGSSSSQLHHRPDSLGSQLHSRPVSSWTQMNPRPGILGSQMNPRPGISRSQINPKSSSSGSQVHSRTVSSANGQVHTEQVPSANGQMHSRLKTHKPASVRRPESLPTDRKASISGSKNLNGIQRLVSSKPQPSIMRQNVEQRRISHEPSRSQMVPKQSSAASKHQIIRPLKQAPSRDAIDDRRPKKKPKKMSEDDMALSMIRKMFKTDRFAGREVDDDDSDMEANFDDIMREESRSARIARKEDEEQLRLIEEEERQERMRKLAKKRKLSHHH